MLADAVNVFADTTLAPVILPTVDILPNVPLPVATISPIVVILPPEILPVALIVPVALKLPTFALPTTFNIFVV